jgi:hypothetical protein
VPVRDGEEELDRSCEKLRSITKHEVGQQHPHTTNIRKANCTGHTLLRNCLLKHIIEGKIEEGQCNKKTRKKT